jgi:hypothetical protein
MKKPETMTMEELAPYASEWHRRITRLRNSRAGGRPHTLRPCPFCGKQFGARELRAHKPRCTRNLKRTSI